MKWRYANHPVSDNASRVILACFVGLCALAVIDVVRMGNGRPTWFWVSAGTIGFVLACSLITYFRPRGATAFVTSTAYVGLFVMFGAAYGTIKWQQLTGRKSVVVTGMMAVTWLLIGLLEAWRAHQFGRRPE